jgi:copper chaperone CopZ
MWPLLLALSATAADVAPPHAVVTISGMDCAGCHPHVVESLRAVPGVTGAVASFESGAACVDLSATTDPEKLRAAVKKAGYEPGAVEAVAECPASLKPKDATDPWANPGPLDAQVVSRGEEVALADHLVPNKFTVVDFGASWCAPCHTTAALLAEYLEHHADTAVRAVSLPGRDPKASFASPAAKQHLKWAAGLPYLLVYAPDGKEIYRGGDVLQAMSAIDKKRK